MAQLQHQLNDFTCFNIALQATIAFSTLLWKTFIYNVYRIQQLVQFLAQRNQTTSLLFCTPYTGSLCLKGSNLKFLLLPTKLNMVYIAPKYISELLIPKSNLQLVFSDHHLPPTQNSTLVLSPHSLWKPLLLYFWNNLPVHICASTKLDSFKTALKTHLFKSI